jgi:hypothetical protein
MPGLFTASRTYARAATVAAVAWAGSTACRAEILPPSWQEIRTAAAAWYEVTLPADAAFEGHGGASVRCSAPLQKQLDFGGLSRPRGHTG